MLINIYPFAPISSKVLVLVRDFLLNVILVEVSVIKGIPLKNRIRLNSFFFIYLGKLSSRWFTVSDIYLRREFKVLKVVSFPIRDLARLASRG